jgi:polyhydroxyalkanoate synthase
MSSAHALPLAEHGAAAPPRRGPRPLALHLALAAASREPGAGLPARFLAGLQAYWRHPYRRRMAEPPTLWSEGSTRLLDYGSPGGVPLLAVPSLINRAYILDLAPGRSLLRHLAGQNLRPLLVDWGRPGPCERRMTLDGYVMGPLAGALAAARRAGGAPPLLLGYCMGGLLATALAVRRPEQIAGLALLATPWDFHAGALPEALRGLLARAAQAGGLLGGLPVELMQSLFAGIDPQGVARKFARFGELQPDAAEAEGFVAIEDWLNDGVPLGAGAAEDCLRGWYGENRPARGRWRIGGAAVLPERVGVPCLVAIPTRDRIVPPASAVALAARLPAATLLRPQGGHVGMVAGGRAREQLWTPLAAWLRRIAAMQN